MPGGPCRKAYGSWSSVVGGGASRSRASSRRGTRRANPSRCRCRPCRSGTGPLARSRCCAASAGVAGPGSSRFPGPGPGCARTSASARSAGAWRPPVRTSARPGRGSSLAPAGCAASLPRAPTSCASGPARTGPRSPRGSGARRPSRTRRLGATIRRWGFRRHRSILRGPHRGPPASIDACGRPRRLQVRRGSATGGPHERHGRHRARNDEIPSSRSSEGISSLEIPAATYSPRGPPPKYHRRGRA